MVEITTHAGENGGKIREDNEENALDNHYW
jgi:hypothetical protein